MNLSLQDQTANGERGLGERAVKLGALLLQQLLNTETQLREREWLGNEIVATDLGTLFSDIGDEPG